MESRTHETVVDLLSDGDKDSEFMKNVSSDIYSVTLVCYIWT